MKKIILFLFLSLYVSFLFSQSKLVKQQLDTLPNTIENQFLKTYSFGKNWNEYKMINKNEFLTFQKNILDSVTTLKNKIITTNQIITKKQSKITSLENEIKSINENLNEAKSKEDSINFLGTTIKKDLYNSILWGIIGLLLLCVIFFIYKYKSNISITKDSKKNLIELEEEFESHRKKTIEKEQKLRRQLHDEVNKNKGL